MELTEEQFQRYARHLILDEVGEEGQVRLLSSRVLVIGAGGLGSPLLLYLAAAGVGTLGITDADRVDLTNLQRQIVHATERVGDLKVDSARATLAAVNDGIRIETHPTRLAPENAADIIAGYDLVADDDFILGPVPGAEEAYTGVGWRGTGYKFAPWVGRVLAQLAVQQGTVYDISRFAPGRFARGHPAASAGLGGGSS